MNIGYEVISLLFSLSSAKIETSSVSNLLSIFPRETAFQSEDVRDVVVIFSLVSRLNISNQLCKDFRGKGKSSISVKALDCVFSCKFNHDQPPSTARMCDN